MVPSPTIPAENPYGNEETPGKGNTTNWYSGGRRSAPGNQWHEQHWPTHRNKGYDYDSEYEQKGKNGIKAKEMIAVLVAATNPPIGSPQPERKGKKGKKGSK